MADKKKILDVTISGEVGDGKSTLAWLMLSMLETFGATVKVTTVGDSNDIDIGEFERDVNRFREYDHNLHPGHLRDLTVNITTQRIEREDYDG